MLDGNQASNELDDGKLVMKGESSSFVGLNQDGSEPRG